MTVLMYLFVFITIKEPRVHSFTLKASLILVLFSSSSFLHIISQHLAPPTSLAVSGHASLTGHQTLALALTPVLLVD